MVVEVVAAMVVLVVDSGGGRHGFGERRKKDISTCQQLHPQSTIDTCLVCPCPRGIYSCAVVDNSFVRPLIWGLFVAKHSDRYVDKMLEMIAVAGDFVAGAVWHRIIQIVTNHKDLQARAGFDFFCVFDCFLFFVACALVPV